MTLMRFDKGIALPISLFMLLVIGGVTAILSKTAIKNLEDISINTAAAESYFASEGVMHKMLGDMSSKGTLWKEQPPLGGTPAGYTEFSPLSYSGTNGLPPCSGVACHREMYPIGGGLLKNVGPLLGDGASVDTGYSISEQLNISSPQTEDESFGNLKAWSQVERLDEITPSAASVGGNLSNTVAEGGNANVVRFRITGKSLRSLKGRKGISTVVSIIEMPAA